MKKFNEFVEHTKLEESSKFLTHIDREAIEKEFANIKNLKLDSAPKNIREWIKFFDELDWWGKVIDAHIHGTKIDVIDCPFDYKKSPREFIADLPGLKSTDKNEIEKAFLKAGTSIGAIDSVVKAGTKYLNAYILKLMK